MDEREIIKSYSKAWKIEKRIYSIGNIKLPLPIAPRQLFYFALSALAIYILSQIFPPLKVIPTILRYLALPILITWLANKVKPDGKNPFKFFGKLIIHILTINLYRERFKANLPAENNKISLNWWCSYINTGGHENEMSD